MAKRPILETVYISLHNQFLEFDSSFYIGYTKDVFERLKGHNNGKTPYTKKKIPWKLVYYEVFKIKSDAIKRENFLKRQKNRDFYQKLIDNWSGSSVG
jgi:putative endonuclease